jgi:signal transduction histidine kinase
MASVLDIQTLGGAVTRGLATRVPLAQAAFCLADGAPDRFVRRSRAASGGDERESLPVELDPILVLWLRVTGRTLVVEDLAYRDLSDPRMRGAIAGLERAGVPLLVPLVLDGQLTAILAAGEKLSGDVFSTVEIELIEALTGQTAVALKNSLLYEDLKTRMVELARTQQQLVQSAKLAAIGELAASVAHELNNPLQVILGYSDLMRMEIPEDSPAHRRVAKIETETRRAGKIVRDLLGFARRREPKREPVELHPLLSRALDLLQARFREAHVVPQTVLDPAVLSVLGDVDQLMQVFINLLTNAVDAMPDGGTLVLRTERREGETGPTIAVAVSDEGVGMTAAQISQIFEPFYTTKPEGRGTGLGLSVSLGIVKKHGGRSPSSPSPARGRR